MQGPELEKGGQGCCPVLTSRKAVLPCSSYASTSRLPHFPTCTPTPTQGPELEKEGKDIGIVTAIAAPAAFKVDFFGDGGHAGAQLMPLRCALRPSLRASA